MAENENLIGGLFDESQCRSEITEHLPVNRFKFTDHVTVKRVYLLARIIARVFREHGITYWTTGGTTLGCVRHKGLIPWDDDLDICVLGEDEDRLLKLKDILLLNGVAIEESFSGYGLYHITESEPIPNPVGNELLCYRYPFCDVYIMRRNSESGRIEIRNGRSRICWNNEWYEESEVYPLQEKLFGDLFLSVPANPIPYLHRSYGEDCMNVGKTHNYEHLTRSSMRSEVVDHTRTGTREFLPATPFC